MPASKARVEANARYDKKTYERATVLFKKGQRDVVTAHAKTRNESLNGFINRAIDNQIDRDKEGDSP